MNAKLKKILKLREREGWERENWAANPLVSDKEN